MRESFVMIRTRSVTETELHFMKTISNEEYKWLVKGRAYLDALVECGRIKKWNDSKVNKKYQEILLDMKLYDGDGMEYKRDANGKVVILKDGVVIGSQG